MSDADILADTADPNREPGPDTGAADLETHTDAADSESVPDAVDPESEAGTGTADGDTNTGAADSVPDPVPSTGTADPDSEANTGTADGDAADSESVPDNDSGTVDPEPETGTGTADGDTDTGAADSDPETVPDADTVDPESDTDTGKPNPDLESDPDTADPDLESDQGTDTGEPARIGWLDRRRDLAGWLLTPLATVVFAPLAAAAIGVVLLLVGDLNQSPAICKAVLPDNGCEETTLGMLGEHLALFGAAWLLLWLVPWWRGLLLPRVALALAVSAILIDVPIQMAR